MTRNNKATVLSLAAAFGFAGCSQTQSYPLSAKGRGRWTPVDEKRIADAPEAPPPKILPETFFAAGLLLERQGRIEAAIHQYRKATAVNHGFAAGYHRLGLLLSAAGRHDEAVEPLRRAAEINPDNAVVLNNLGYELMLLQQWSEAERHLSRAVQIEPQFARACINHGMVLAKLDRFDESLEGFRRVLPEADAQYNLGLMYRGQRRYREAAERFAHVLDLDPNFTAAAVQLNQLAPRLERTAWNPPSPPSTAHNPAVFPLWPCAADAIASTTENSTSGASIAGTSQGEALGMAPMQQSMELEPFGPFPGDSSDQAELELGAAVTDRFAEFDSEGLSGLDQTESSLPSPMVLPTADFSRYSTPPTSRDIHDALAIVRNEIACLEEQERSRQTSMMFSEHPAEGHMSESGTSYSVADDFPSSTPAFEEWLMSTEGRRAGEPGSEFWPRSRQRTTMGMSILRPERSSSSVAPSEFHGPPSPDQTKRNEAGNARKRKSGATDRLKPVDDN